MPVYLCILKCSSLIGINLNLQLNLPSLLKMNLVLVHLGLIRMSVSIPNTSTNSEIIALFAHQNSDRTEPQLSLVNVLPDVILTAHVFGHFRGFLAEKPAG